MCCRDRVIVIVCNPTIFFIMPVFNYIGKNGQIIKIDYTLDVVLNACTETFHYINYSLVLNEITIGL